MKAEIENIVQVAKGKIPSPVTIELLFGEGCNQNCKFCSIHDGRNKPYGLLNIQNKLSKSDYLRIINEAHELSVKRFQLSGEGEPLFNRKVTIPLMKLIKEYNMYGFLNTNGGLFQEQDIKELVMLGWDKILFSIESPDPNTHDYLVSCKNAHKKAIHNVKRFNYWKKKLNKTVPEMEFKMIVTNKNYFQIEEMVKFTQSLNVNFRLDSLIVFHDYGKKLALNEKEKKVFGLYLKKALKLAQGSKYWFSVSDELFDNVASKSDNHYTKKNKNEIKKFNFPKKNTENTLISSSCYFPWFRMLINVQGFVGPCGFAYTKTNVKEKSLKEIWNGNYFERFRKDIAHNKFKDLCQFCGIWRFRLNNQLRNELVHDAAIKKIQYFREKNKLHESVKLSKTILEIVPDNIWILNELMLDLVELEKTDEITILCEKAKDLFLKNEQENLQFHPFKEWITKEIGDWYSLKGNDRIAKEKYQKSIKDNKFDLDSKYKLSLKELSEFWGDYFMPSLEFHNAKKYYKKSLQFYKKELKKVTKNKSIRNNEFQEINKKIFQITRKIGYCYWYEKKSNKAIPFLLKSLKDLENKQESIKILILIGEHYFSEKNFEKAKDLFKKAYTLSQDTSEKSNLMNLIGQSDWNQKKFNKAIPSFNNLTTTLQKKLKNFSYFSKKSNECEESVKILNYIGKCFWSQKDFKNAINYFKQALTIDNNNSNAIRNLGECYFELNDLKKASNLLNKSIKLNPNDSWAYFSLGKVLWKKKENKKSINSIKKAIILSKNEIPLLTYHAWMLLSMNYYDLQDYKNSIFWFNKTKNNTKLFKKTESKEEKLFKIIIQKKRGN